MKGRAVVIGIGNPYRRDDGVGIVVAERLRGRTPEPIDVIDRRRDASDILNAWESRDGVILVDALGSGREPGGVHLFEPLVTPLPRERFRHSTHSLGVPEAIELGRRLGRPPLC